MLKKLTRVINNTPTIQSRFQEKFEAILGEGTKMKNDMLSVFYKEDILSNLDRNDTPIKLHNDLIYIWNGVYWESVESPKMKRFIVTYIRKRGLIKHTSSIVVDGVFKDIRTELDGYDYKKDMNKQFINMLNGTLLIGGSEVKLIPHAKENHLDYVLDFEYNQEAVNKKWQSFLNDVIPNSETQRTLQQVIGNLLIRGLKIEVLPFLYGTGGNGKSVVLEVLTGLFGRNNVTTYSLTKISTDEKVRARIADGKIMNLSSENNMGNVNVDVAKNYSSNEPLDARLNYGNPFEIYDYAKFLGNVNKLNVMDGERTEAIARRQIIIPFSKTISAEKRDINIHKKILKDKAGLLNWIVEGIRSVIDNESIYISREVKALLKDYHEETNPVALLIKEHDYNLLSEKTSKKHFATLRNLYTEYKDFVTEIGVGKLSRTNFKNDLLSIKGVREYKYNNKICFNLSKLVSETKSYKTILEENRDNLNKAQIEVLERKAKEEVF